MATVAPPAKTEISDTYPNPSNAVARAGFAKLYDYLVNLLGTVGSASDARTALGIPFSNWTKTIYGFTYQNNVADAVNDIDIAAGGAVDSAGTYWINGAASTKRLDAAWAVGSGQGGLDTGAIGNSDYYIWAIARSDTGVVDYLFSLSDTAPTMPASYDKKRMIGWFKRVGATIVAFHTYESEGGGLDFSWDAPTIDINLTNTLTTARRTDAVKVPLTFSVLVEITAYLRDNAASGEVWIGNPSKTDVALALPQSANVSLVAGVTSVPTFFVRTSAAGLIAAKAAFATVDSYLVATNGFNWSRRS